MTTCALRCEGERVGWIRPIEFRNVGAVRGGVGACILCSFDEYALQGGSERGMFACVSEEDEHAAADSAVQDQWS
jgi:hypothetical protein